MTSKPVPAPTAPDVLDRALLPLRAFLGFTFCFAGLQKLANPRFFDAADPASIQAQLAGAVRRSPVHPLIPPLTHVAVPLGILIALGELAVGVGTLPGFRARLAAAGGLVLSLMLFLTVSFHSSPYYTGGGPRVRVRLDSAAAGWFWLGPVPGRGHRGLGPPAGRRGPATRPTIRTRRTRDPPPRSGARGMTTAGVAAVSLVVGGLTAGLGRLAGGTAGQAGTPSLPPAAAPVPTATAGPSRSSAPKSGKVPSGTAIGPAADVPVGQAASFQDPATGDPSIVIQPRSGQFVAFDAVCPHAGCTVGYDAAAKVIICPCHGSQFNASTGAVEVGPAATGLKRDGRRQATGSARDNVMLDALNRHANVALLAGQVPMGPNATALWKRCIAVMLDSGFRSRLPRVYATVACYVVGFALQFSARGVSKEHPGDVLRSTIFGASDLSVFPATSRSLTTCRCLLRDEFAFGLGLLVEGLSGGSTPQAASRRRTAVAACSASERLHYAHAGAGTLTSKVRRSRRMTLTAAVQDAGAGLRRRFWLPGEPGSMLVFAGAACAGVLDGQRVGFSCEGGEVGRHLGQAGPDVGGHGAHGSCSSPVVLVAGVGFGDGEAEVPFLTGRERITNHAERL